MVDRGSGNGIYLVSPKSTLGVFLLLRPDLLIDGLGFRDGVYRICFHFTSELTTATAILKVSTVLKQTTRQSDRSNGAIFPAILNLPQFELLRPIGVWINSPLPGE